jgi:oxygen-independent coproporphyrinogen-3 oxidase
MGGSYPRDTHCAMDDLGVYLHVPFCERICPYCDFPVVAARTLGRATEERYVAALQGELAARRGDFAGRTLATIYLGGGTPSLLAPESVRALVAAVRAAFPGEPAEVTLEVNPSTLERERLPGFRAAGVDRVSVGIQSFDDTTLRRLGRAHRAREGERTLAACRDAGFTRLSLDLIAAAPGQDLAAFDRDLAAAIAVAPDHVSVYELTLEPGTPFASAAASGRLATADEELAVSMLERAEQRLGAAGYHRYEISSYARPGREARHNQRYWQRRPVLGLGMGAVSSDPPSPGRPYGVRRTNPRTLDAYLTVASGERPAELEILAARAARGEAVFLALRTSAGLDAHRFAAEFGAAPRAYFADAIDTLRAQGLLAEADTGGLSLTPRGRMLSDSVFAYFV